MLTRRAMLCAMALTTSVVVFGTATPAALAATYTVDDTGDAGDAAPGNGVCATDAGVCTLRAAIDETNARPGRDTISFGFTGTGPFVIQLASALPSMFDPAGTVIDGYTQAGATPNTDPLVSNAVIQVEVRGGGPNGFDGFLLGGPNNVIRGLAIREFRLSIRMFGTDSFDNQILGNFLGLDATGTVGAPFYVRGAMSVNMQAGAHDNVVGAPGAANRNVISGNYHHGVATYDEGTDRNKIQNNLIGSNPAGTAAITNWGHGVDINTWSSFTLIGGTGAQERNVIVGSGQSGVEISHGAGTEGNQVIGNLIGTAPDGLSAPAWAHITQFGVNLEGMAQCSTQCDPDMHDSVVTDNVIVNATGGIMLQKATHDDVVARNKIGVLANGTPAPNSVFGIRIEKGSFHNTIGPGNEIAYNPNGVQLVPDGTNPPAPDFVATPNNRFTQNSIHDNGGLGIDLAPLGAVTPTPDPLINQGAALPTITAATGATATISTCAGCTIELFRSDGAQGAFGEGREYLGTAVANGSGVAKVRIPAAVRGAVITATSTTPTGSTSEFSAGRNVPNARPGNTAPTAAATVSCVVTLCTLDASAATDPGGTIEWYSWNLGNGTTIDSATPVTTYDYKTVGTFTVALTVVDDDGATATVTRTATPSNQLPSGSFTTSCDLQQCTFASTGTDPDGTITAHSWDFGGQGASAQANPTFTFPAAGSFVVSHTVTDNSGGTGTSTATVTISAFPNGLIGLDGFSRTAANGWGSASVGGAWTFPLGNNTAFSVDGTRGAIDIASGGALRVADLAGVRQQDVTVTATWSADKAPVGWGLTAHVTARRTGINSEYRARLRLSSSGSAYLAIVRISGSSDQVLLGPEVQVPGLVAAAGTNYRISLQATGTNPTTLRAKAWLASSAEPGSWLITQTDSTVPLQAIGSVGVGAAPWSGQTNLPVRYRFDDLQVVTLNTAPTPAFTASCTNQACTFDSSASSDPDGTIVFRSWNFGDGAVASGSGLVTTSRTYATFGSFLVTLTVTDNKGGSATTTVPVPVTNAPPVPTITQSCAELTCTFSSAGTVDPDGTIASYAWTFGDGATSTAASPAHTYAVSDIYTVTLTVTDDDGTPATDTVTLEPSRNPIAAFTSTCNVTSCAFDARASADPDGTVVSWAWDFGDGITGTGSTPTHVYNGPGPYTVALTVTDNVGGTGTITHPVDPNAPPVPVIDVTCDATLCSFDSSTSSDPDGTIASRSWTFGDGGTSTAVAPTHTYATGGTFTVTLVVTDDLGASATATKTVGISLTPIATFTSTCTLLDCSFDATGSNDPDGTPITFLWEYGDGTTGTGLTSTHIYLTGAPVTVRLSVTDAAGSVGRTTRALDPNAPPTPAFTFTCTGLSCSFDAAGSTDDRTISTYAWTFGDGATATGITASRTYAGKAPYTVTLTVTDDQGVARTLSKTVVPNTAPTASFTVVCPTTTCSFDASASADPDGTIATYAWAFGDGTTGTGVTTSHTYPDLAPRTVSLTVTDNDGATGTTTRSARGNQPPTASFTASCTGNTCTVDASASADVDGTIAAYAWAWGDGTTGTGVTATHSYNTVLPTSIGLIVTDDAGGTGGATQPITLTRLVATDSFSRSVNNGFGSADVGGSWTAFGGTGNGQGFTVSSGTGKIDLLTAGAGRSARLLAAFAANTDVTVRVRTDVAATGFGEMISIIGRRTGTNLEYRARLRFAPGGGVWLAAVKNVNSATETLIGAEVQVPGITHTPGTWYRVRAQFDGANPTTIRIRVWVDGTPEPATWQLVRTDAQTQLQNGGSIGLNTALSSSATAFPVRFEFDDLAARLVTTPPVPAFTSSCTGLTCTFDAGASSDPDGTIAAYEWDFGDGTTGTGVTASHAYATGGPRTVTLRLADNEGALAATTGTATPQGTNQPPVAGFTSSCVGRVCTFNGTTSSDPDGTVTGWAWTFGDGATGTGTIATATYAAAGNYTVTLTVTDDRGGTASTSVTVTVIDDIATDAFNRTVSGGWGTADLGGAWTARSGAPSDFAVTPGVASVSLTPGSGKGQRLAVSATSTDVSATVSANQPSSGFGIMASVVGRVVSSTNEYRVRARFAPDGKVYLALVKINVSSAEQLIGAEVLVSGVTYTPGTQYGIRLSTVGTSPTTLSAKIWPAAGAEPPSWQVSATDASVGLQAPGGVGLHAVLSGSATITPVIVSFSNFSAR